VVLCCAAKRQHACAVLCARQKNFGHRGKMVAKWTKRLATAVLHTSLVARSGGQLCVHCPRREPSDCAAEAVLTLLQHSLLSSAGPLLSTAGCLHTGYVV
jgi:hypothetical protein